MKTYFEKLKDPRWQRKRLEIMSLDEFSCGSCGDKSSQLNVHHRYYITGRMPWEYPDWSLITLCNECHKERHDMDESRHEAANLPREQEFETIMTFLCDQGREFEEMAWDIAAQIGMMRSDLGNREALEKVLFALSNLRLESQPKNQVQ